jgi:lysylphosphatidylglycerol synthetase-like protein (DUF2156 family)
MRVHENKAVAEYIDLWGNSASQALLDSKCQLFSVPTIQGIIGYRFESKTAVVFGDPVCAPEEMPALAWAFQEFCDKKGKSIVYISATEQFTDWAIHHVCKTLISFGNEVILNPMENAMLLKGKRASLLRNKWNQSVRDGIEVKEYITVDQALESAMEGVAHAWLNDRKGPQMSLLRVNLFEDRTCKRWFYAQYKGKVVGVLMLNSLASCKGWVINMMMTDPTAPNPTSEFLVLSTLQVLRAEQCTYFSIGTTPAAELKRIEGISIIIAWIARSLFAVAKKIFKLSDRQRYWKKFYPQTKPLYLLFSNSSIKIQDIMAIMRALNAENKSVKNRKWFMVRS